MARVTGATPTGGPGRPRAADLQPVDSPGSVPQPADPSLAGPAPRGLWSPGRRRLTAGLVAAVTLVALESLSVATILPVIGRQLGDIGLYGWVFSAFFLTSLVGIALAGVLADRRSLVAPLAGGLACFAAGLVVGGLAPSMPVLVLGRALQGLGAGAVPAAAYTAIGRTYEPAARPRMLAVLSTAWVAPSVIGPTAAAAVASGPGWRWVLLGLVPAVAAAAAVCVPALRDVPRPAATPPPGPASAPAHAPATPAPTYPAPATPAPTPATGAIGAALTVAAGAALVLAGLSSSSWPAAVLLVLVGTPISGAGLRRLVPRGTLRAAPGLPAAVATRGLLTFGYFAVDAYVPLALTSVRHTSTAFGGIALTIASFTWTAGSWAQARLVAVLGPRRLVQSGMAVLVVGIGLFAAALLPATPTWVALVAWGIAGFGIGTAYSPISLTALDRAPPGGEGRASAAVQLTDTLGTALGTGVGGAAVAFGQRSGWAPRSGLGVAFAAAVGVLVVGQASAARVPALLRHREVGEHCRTPRV